MIARAANYLAGFTAAFWLKLMGGALVASLAFGGVQTIRHAMLSADHAKLQRDHALARAQLAEKARKADEVGQRTANATTGTAEAQNEAARNAAANSDDPLKAALDELGRNP